MMARVAESKRKASPMDSVEAQVREFKYLKKETDELGKRSKVIRDDLMKLVENTGFEDDQGHYWLEFDDGIDGTDALQRQRRVSRSLDEDQAEEVLKTAGIWEECTDLVRVVNEDRVMQALYDEKLNDVAVDKIYPPKITWALVLK
jgi:hypothetical protein